MTDRFDTLEKKVGISAYLSKDHEGFAAVSKARYSDFLVHEVDINGNIARLESLDVPSETKEEESRKRKHSEDEEEDEDPWARARNQLCQWVSTEVSDETVSMLQYWEGRNDVEGDDSPKHVTLPPLPDKDTRRAVHLYIKSPALSLCAVADTHEGRIRVWHKRFEMETSNYGKGPKNRHNRPARKEWPADRPDFLKFVLYKENLDTGVATKDISRRLNGKNRGRIKYAGMKDKRGVTTQFITLYRRFPEELKNINMSKERNFGGGNSSHGGTSVMRVGHFSFTNQELQLGMLQGNRFDIALRNVDVGDVDATSTERLVETKAQLEKSAQAFEANGFINYFGMQRFGKFMDTHLTGIEVLKGNFEAAADLILRPKANEHPQTTQARNKWQDRFASIGSESNKSKVESTCAKQVAREMGRFATCEVAILNSLVHRPLDYKRAFCTIPKNYRMMFLHATQSLLWNKVATYRIEKLGTKPVVGDLVLIGEECEENGTATSGLRGKSVKVLTADDVEAGTFDLKDVVLPLVGTKIEYPQNESGAYFDTLLEEMGLRKKDFGNLKVRELKLGGDYRRLICRPSDVDHQIVEYTDPHQPLLQTDLMKVNGIEFDLTPNADKRILLGMIVGFTLPPSSYATIALRELMKRPTSSEYQRLLQLEGPCEYKLETTEGAAPAASSG